MDEIEWDKEKLQKFKLTYKTALRNHHVSFIFDKHEFILSYAKYLIEYLEQQFKD